MDIVQYLMCEPKRKIFFDKDGLLAYYDRWAYVPNENGIMPFEIEENHYFRTCKRDDKAYDLLKKCISFGHEVYILTKVPPECGFIRQDVLHWVKENIPEIDDKHIIIAESDKAELIKVIHDISSLNKNMILIDDFNPNLWGWQEAGGDAIKYINGVNSPNTFGGPEFTL